jgi:hypothetical protein
LANLSHNIFGGYTTLQFSDALNERGILEPQRCRFVLALLPPPLLFRSGYLLRLFLEKTLLVLLLLKKGYLTTTTNLEHLHGPSEALAKVVNLVVESLNLLMVLKL